MAIEIITDRETWDSFIDASPQGLLFHKWDFLRITEQHTGYTCLPYGIYKGDELVCACPLFHKRENGLSVILSPPPLQAVIPYLGFVMSRDFTQAKQSKKESIMQLVADELEAEVQDLAPNYLSLRLIPDFHDIRQFIWGHYGVKVNYTYSINLEPSLEDLWNNLSAKLRTSVRKYEKDGYYLERGSDLNLFYESVTKRFSQPSMNIPMITRQYFEDIFSAYPEYVHVYHLYDRNGEIKGVGTTQEYKRYILWVGGPKLNGTSANEYLQWLLIRDAKLKGFPEFENVGANNPKLNMHKSKFNPDLAIFLEMSKMDMKGRAAQWVYSNIINRPWVKKRVISYVE